MNNTNPQSEVEVKCTCGEPHISDRITHRYDGKPCYVTDSVPKESPVSQCPCACHQNTLKKPYEHSSKCCDDMNGAVSQSVECEKRWEIIKNCKECTTCLETTEMVKSILTTLVKEMEYERTVAGGKMFGTSETFRNGYDAGIFAAQEVVKKMGIT